NKGLLGISGPASDPLYQIVGATPFQATYEFMTWDGTPGGLVQGTDIADFYANNNGGSNSGIINTSIDFEFWWSVKKITAKNVQVGTCKASIPSFSSIQTALAAVPSGATIQICPGSYAEQLTINAPITLQGVNTGNNQAAVLTVPSGGLIQNGTGP